MGYGPEHRKRAQQLGALEAKQLVGTIAGLEGKLTPAQMKQIQMVLDAAMLNPVLRKEADDAYKGSIIAESGGYAVRDPHKEARANRLSERIIPIEEWDKRIKLDWHQLLSADALQPRSNNPDEASYLGKVRTTLDERGIWLRLNQPYGSGGNRTSPTDPRRWEIWFSLGPNGDTVPSGGDAVIDRDELLGTTMLGAGYHRAVWTGPTQLKLKRLLAQLESAFDDGFQEHTGLQRDRRQAPFMVAEISELLGGADLPPLTIWNRPHSLIIASINSNTAGDVITAQAQLLAAALEIERNARQLHAYSEKISTGAGRAVSFLKVLRAAGYVAEAGLAITGVGAVLKAGRVGVAGAEAAALAEREAVDEAATKLVREYAAKNGITEAELEAVQVVKTPGGAGTKLGSGTSYGQSTGHGTGFHEW